MPRRTSDPTYDLRMADAARRAAANSNTAWVEPDRPERQAPRTLATEPPREPLSTRKPDAPLAQQPPEGARENRQPIRPTDVAVKQPAPRAGPRAEPSPPEPETRPVAAASTPPAKGPAQPAATTPAPGASDWSIVLVVFRGEGNAEAAKIAQSRIQKEGGLPEAFLQRRGPAWAVVYGRYSGPEDPQAQTDLKRVQEMEVSGVRLYAGTYICPPPEGNAPIRSEMDLRNAKGVYGKDALYTLQVGFYGREDVAKLAPADAAEIRKAAEEAALRLRQEGELAFFYHGPNRSMVTVGVYDFSDFDPQKPGVESQRLREAKQRHPYNLYNGAGYTGKVPGMNKSKLVPSGLVGLPKR